MHAESGRGPVTTLDDLYYKKTVSLDIGGRSFSFRVSQTLFSSQSVDVGTELLLRTIHRTGANFEKVLDLGCGYGPIGVVLKGLNPTAELHMVDRDALAVEYAAQNALLNGIDDAATCGSLGFDDVEDRDFDLIAANIPGKAGRGVISSWLKDAPLFLRGQGQIGVVVVSALESFVGKVIEAMEGVDIVVRQSRAGHTAFVCSVRGARGPLPSPPKSFHRGDYDRAQTSFSHGRLEYGLTTVFGLPQFDSLSYRTRLLSNVLQNLDGRPDRVLVLNPGQGHVPVILSRALAPGSIVMVDRDLLALRCSERSLLADGYDGSSISMRHQSGLADGELAYDLIVAEMRDAEGPRVIGAQFRQAASQLRPGGRMVIAANSATITRLSSLCKRERLGSIEARKRRHGSSVLVVASAS